jgi:hypothetical protein
MKRNERSQFLKEAVENLPHTLTLLGTMPKSGEQVD